MLIVPSQSAGIRTFIKLLRGGNSPSVKGVVVPAVLELFPNTSADLEIEIGCYGHIAGLVFAFPILPRNDMRFNAANNLGSALGRPSDFTLRDFCEVGNPSRGQGLVGSVYSRSVAEATVYDYTFLLATQNRVSRDFCRCRVRKIELSAARDYCQMGYTLLGNMERKPRPLGKGIARMLKNPKQSYRANQWAASGFLAFSYRDTGTLPLPEYGSIFP